MVERRPPEGAVAAEPQAAINTPRQLALPPRVAVKDLADALGHSPIEIIKELMKNGVMASINQVIDIEAAVVVASSFGFEVTEAPPELVPGAIERRPDLVEDNPELLQPRPPVVTIMGHVDHGKTSLLDAIRQSNIIAHEAGGITQHIGAYQVDVEGQKITFLDTPGHEAFTAMRARGAKATDIAVLVIAANDGVMPQTEEAISHARAAGVPIVVAINKIDRPDATPERVKQQLTEHGLLIEEWGGDVPAVSVSARTGEGIRDLLDNILVVAEVAELKANPNRPALGVVIEAELDKKKGPMATVLVQSGTLQHGDSIVAGQYWGRVKAMFNERGRSQRRAEPSTPVSILGLNGVPQAGDTFAVIANERTARSLSEAWQQRSRTQAEAPSAALTLDDLFAQLKAGKVKELPIILKTDVQGSIEPIRTSLERLGTEEVKVRVIHAAPGSITESDVLLASASNGVIIGFGSRVETGARRLADAQRVDVRNYDVIYELVDDVKRAMEGMLEPVYVDVLEGRAEVRQVFPMGRHHKAAGGHVLEGRAARNATVKVRRGAAVVAESSVGSLRRFKDDVREVAAGFEFGISLDGFDDFVESDILEFYRRERRGGGEVSR